MKNFAMYIVKMIWSFVMSFLMVFFEVNQKEAFKAVIHTFWMLAAIVVFGEFLIPWYMVALFFLVLNLYAALLKAGFIAVCKFFSGYRVQVA